jgi:hypothetical protein
MLDRRHFLAATTGLAGILPALDTVRTNAIPETHFPSRLHQFVWRNWELSNAGRMAEVVATTPANILRLGRSMGLGPKPVLSSGQLRRIYITTIRQNTHLLPDAQIIQLLGWTPERYAFTLREDDFLQIKLGPSKPACAELIYRDPAGEERRAAARLAKIVKETLGSEIARRGEAPFDFVARLSAPLGRPRRPAPAGTNERWTTRYLYSHFALYGDPLMEPDLDPFPDGYLERLADCGINGVWMQAVLETLAPSKHFPEFGQGSETRLANLRRLVERAHKFGVKVYLYLNEPRSKPDAFFARHPDLRGSKSQEFHAMCTSAPVVRDWIASSLEHVFRQAPALGGLFSITMSENLTNCFSHSNGWAKAVPVASGCPRCSRRTSWDVIAELLDTFRQGVRRASPMAEIIAYDWGWGEGLAGKLIPLLASDVKLLSISEWHAPVERGGVRTRVGEYSISVVGPGPRATRNWRLASERGLQTLAKTQFNNTWEISAVPYIPVPGLIVDHCLNLTRAGIGGVMASWTCGGYPSLNLEAAEAVYRHPHPTKNEILARLAARRYGAGAAPQVVEAWEQFARAFQEFPYGAAIYTIPTQHGPANLLRLKPTGHRAAMILFPHDDLKGWCGAYPPEVVLAQFRKMADAWKRGLAVLERALGRSRGAAEEDLAVARTCYNHFASVANQVEFYLLRPKLGSAPVAGAMRDIARRELALAVDQYRIARRHSVIAYEASNHYYYRPLDLVEKIFNCREIIEELNRYETS